MEQMRIQLLVWEKANKRELAAGEVNKMESVTEHVNHFGELGGEYPPN